MKQLLSRFSASVSELKRNPSALLMQAAGNPIVILNHNVPAAYLVPAATYELLMEKLDDIDLAQLVAERAKEKSKAISINLDDL